LGSNSKISKLDLAGLGEEDVGCLDVSVNLALSVQVLNAQQQFTADDGDVCFAEIGGF
jgi:hypothetical protein